MCGYLCQICGAKMAKLRRRFGGICCNPCASFFQRSITLEDSFVCQNDSPCVIEPSRKGKQCKKCRFQKCLEIGMVSRELIQHIKNKQAMEEAAAADKEYANFALVTETVLKACLKLTPLLEKYLRGEDSLLMTVALQAAKEEKLDLSDQRIQQLILLLKNFPITAEELPMFYHICMCKLEFPHFTDAEKLKMKDTQIIGLQKLLTLTENYDRFFELINIAQNFVNTFLANTVAPATTTM